MVIDGSKPQVDDALVLTRRALEYAREDGRKPGAAIPEVTVTGHSLGGTLAQVTAHHFDLRGETFNAYGAASLGLRIPEGGDRVVNHVMAADAVSAAGTHYGSVRMYATEEEISVLHQSGYQANRFVDVLTPDLPLGALGSHGMHHFLPVDGDGAPDLSILRDQAAVARAQDHQGAIRDYRGDLELARAGVALGARGPLGLVQDGIDAFRGDVPAGAPAASEQGLGDRLPAGAGSGTAHGVADAAYGEGWSDGEGAWMRLVQQGHVERMPDAAGSGDAAAVQAAVLELQASSVGDAWLQRVNAQALQLAARDAVAPQLHELAAQ